MNISSKLPKVGTTIFTVMSALANEHQAINLSQGFPDFETDPLLFDLVYQAMKTGKNQYAPMAGWMGLREEIAKKIYDTHNLTLSPEEEITITSGATEAIFDAIHALIRPQDEVIIFEPAYDCYVPSIELAGGKVVPIALSAPHFEIPWQEVRDKINPKTKMIMINTPHNPTGTTLKAKDMLELIQITQNTDIVILSDEVYEHIIFDGQVHESVLRYPELRERSYVVYSFGKTFHVTGWKIGYCIAPKILTQEFRKVHQFVTFTSATPLQIAYAEYLKNPLHYQNVASFYQQKRDFFRDLLTQHTPFELLPCEGTYFQLVSYKNIRSAQDTEVAIDFTKSLGVATIPISVFYQEPQQEYLLRFCFAKQEQTLLQAIERLRKLELKQ